MHYVYDPQLGGDIATWVSAVGTIIAVLVAAWIFRSESRLTRRALDQTEQEIRTAAEQWELQRFQVASEQASKISGWPKLCRFGEKPAQLEDQDKALVDRWKDVTSRMRDGDAAAVNAYDEMQKAYGSEGPSNAYWALMICENRSQLPVYDVLARVFRLGPDGWVELSVKKWPIWTPDNERVEERIRTAEGQAVLVHPDQAETFIATTRIELNFSDSAGRQWQRNCEGQLIALTA